MKSFFCVFIGFLLAVLFYCWSSYVYISGEKDGYSKKCVDIVEKK